MAKKKKKDQTKDITMTVNSISHEPLLDKLKEAQVIAEQLKAKIRVGKVIGYRHTIIRTATELNNIIRKFR